MIDLTPHYTDEVLSLIHMDSEMITAKEIAPIVKMHPSVIIAKAKAGEWNVCRYVISGTRVKFFRIDFLKAGGWIQ